MYSFWKPLLTSFPTYYPLDNLFSWQIRSRSWSLVVRSWHFQAEFLIKLAFCYWWFRFFWKWNCFISFIKIIWFLFWLICCRYFSARWLICLNGFSLASFCLLSLAENQWSCCFAKCLHLWVSIISTTVSLTGPLKTAYHLSQAFSVYFTCWQSILILVSDCFSFWRDTFVKVFPSKSYGSPKTGPSFNFHQGLFYRLHDRDSHQDSVS